MVKIFKEELRDILKAAHKCWALEQSGVDNWEWYGISIENYLHEFGREYKSLNDIVNKEIEEYKEV